ncbi:DEHA2E04796p [Debaryomyces hansenii CBS767]|uniref:DEHA2E04796p n=1 Tax=Debaryomyces hansenii (strain ATCC 36239 / CBS 767 / BCRC 21394 / JCM 1990 / NBRC 0083 / IGC 2968) TaxID=284592 RepID=Q6BQJ2_DEBHA|nr:DEHA2E04796p [Debaryomyces hansenii CBS767]CAG87755.2 DEHA2E04796p [Debaryomyces hansenii CBS767]|eukprot:XP_459528.2 DEHA2E04796p [Debaryomyces hansenii CBS767]
MPPHCLRRIRPSDHILSNELQGSRSCHNFSGNNVEEYSLVCKKTKIRSNSIVHII